MAFFKVKVDDKQYELEKLTLKEGRILKRDFGLSDLVFFSPSDPDTLVGLLVIAMMKQDGITQAAATEIVEALDYERLVIGDEEEVDEADPTSAAEAATSGADADDQPAPGKSGKPRKTTGKQS